MVLWPFQARSFRSRSIIANYYFKVKKLAWSDKPRLGALWGRDGDTLFINSGPTMQMVASALRSRKNLNVVTNSLNVAMDLGNVPGVRVVLLGGEINAQYSFTYGSDAQEQLSKYQADWAILSVDGISAGSGITTYHAEEAVIDRMMLRGAKQAMVVSDSSKIGRAGFTRVCACVPGMYLVTDGGDSEALAAMASMGVRIVHPNN